MTAIPYSKTYAFQSLRLIASHCQNNRHATEAVGRIRELLKHFYTEDARRTAAQLVQRINPDLGRTLRVELRYYDGDKLEFETTFASAPLRMLQALEALVVFVDSTLPPELRRKGRRKRPTRAEAAVLRLIQGGAE